MSPPFDVGPLLAPDEPPALETFQADASSPFLLTCDHAGRAVPRRLANLELDDEHFDTHIAWDLGAAGFARALAERLVAPLFLQRYSRLVIDCNRPLDAGDSIPERSGGVEIPANQGLDEGSRRARAQEIFRPYHSAIEAELERRRATGAAVVLVTLHSFTPRLWDRDRPWQTGILSRQDRRLAEPLLAALRAEGWTVGDNEPYAVTPTSDYAVNVYGEALGHPYVELEIRQDLLATAAGQNEWAERYARLLRGAAAPWLG
ncbi:MAG TPA: N-formylglutamate amidohydrolase [Polyangiaceae bacterium]|nr:N-formylglutamate amidohydrolase [Polyangiaceae bacterium]